MDVEKIFREARIEPRSGQVEITEELRRLLAEDKDVLFVAPTGWGKTLAVLAALKASARLPALWLARSLELGRRVSEDARKLGLRPFIAAGKAKACAYAGKVGDVYEYCSLHRAQCPFFMKLMRNGAGEGATSWEELPGNVCKYYAQDLYTSQSDIVIQNYFRRTPPARVTVVDEAHNIVKPRVLGINVAELHLAIDELAVEDEELARAASESMLNEFVDRQKLLELADAVANIHRMRLAKLGHSRLGSLVKLLRAVRLGGIPHREEGMLQVYLPPWRPFIQPRIYVSATIPEALEKAFNASVVRVPTEPRVAYVTPHLTTKYGEETVWGFFKLIRELRAKYRRTLAFTTERVAKMLLPVVDYYEERVPPDWRGVALYNIFGRFAEGVDIPADAVAVVGCPFLPPGIAAMMKKYYERLGIQDPEAAYWVPMVTATLQAVGRAIRAPEAQVVVVLADYRFKKYEEHFEPALVFEDYR